MTHAPPRNPTDPPRRRRWYLRWWAFLFFHIPAGLVLAIVLSWFIWLWVATYQRNAALADLRAQGLPTTLQELMAGYQPAPPERNVADEYEIAWSLLEADQPNLAQFNEWQIPSLAMSVEERQEWFKLQAAVAREQADALELVKDVDPLIRPETLQVRADFGTWSQLQRDLAAGDKPAFPYALSLPAVNPARQLAKVLAADARAAASEGDDERALRQVVRLIGISEAVAADAHCLVEYLVSVGIRVMASEAVVDIALHLEDAPAALRATGVELLLDTSALEAAFTRCVEAEMVFGLETVASLDAGRLDRASLDNGDEPTDRGRLLMRLAAPIARGDMALMARYMSALRRATLEATHPAATAVAPPAESLDTMGWRDLFASILLPSVHRAVEAHFRCVADARLAATALAVEACRHSTGQRPRRLEDLVPAYLLAIPRDPMAASAPLRYDASRGFLWSVGTDGIDDGGDVTTTRRGGLRSSRWDGRDAVLELDWTAPSPLPHRPQPSSGQPRWLPRSPRSS